MLVLTRKPGEEIVLPGCNVSVTVLGIRGRAVRLGITAPADIKVLRRELVSAPVPVCAPSLADSPTQQLDMQASPRQPR